MSFSYSGNPGASDLDQVRFLIQDTDSTDAEFTNEEINSVLSSLSAPQAAISLVDRLIAKYARKASNKKVGDLSIDYSQRIDALKALKKALQNDVTLGNMSGAIYAGGISKDDKDTDLDDTDLVQPAFRIGMHDNPGTALDDSEDDL